jgi:shikimate kinase
MGAGKTTTGKRLAKELNLSFIDLDGFIEQRYHKTIVQLFDELGESGFREIEKKMLHEVTEFENVVVAAGGGTPCFSDNMEFMNLLGTTVYLQLSLHQLFLRLKQARSARPLVRNKSDEELLVYISNMLKIREPFYRQAQIIVGDEKLMSNDVCCLTLSLIKELNTAV